MFESNNREGGPGIFWQPAAGGMVERLTNADSGIGQKPESWTRDGKILLFTTRNNQTLQDLWTVSIDGDRKPKLLLTLPREQATLSVVANEGRNYDITPDGKQFVIVMSAVTGTDLTSRQTEQINVVLNWFEELKRRVPAQ